MKNQVENQAENHVETETKFNPDLPHFILIRGLAREARHWGEFSKLLSISMKKVYGLKDGEASARIDCIDLPGAGRFSEMRSPASIDEITEFTRGKFLEIRRKIRDSGAQPAKHTYLIAVSLGGMIASSWFEHWPGDFNGAVLINTSFRGMSPFFKRLRPNAYKHLLGILKNHHDPIGRERSVLELVSNRKDLREETAKIWANIHMMRPVSYENFARQLVAAARFKPRPSKPPLPVLILGSDQDRMVHPSCSAEIAAAWEAEFKSHPTAGHDLPLDAGPWVAENIADWCRRQE